MPTDPAGRRPPHGASAGYGQPHAEPHQSRSGDAVDRADRRRSAQPPPEGRGQGDQHGEPDRRDQPVHARQQHTHRQRVAARRHELRQQGDVEDADLGVEQVGGQPLPGRPPGRALHDDVRCVGAAPSGAHEQPDAEPQQIRGAGVAQHVVADPRGGQQCGDADRRSSSPHEQPGDDAGRGGCGLLPVAGQRGAQHERGVQPRGERERQRHDGEARDRSADAHHAILRAREPARETGPVLPPPGTPGTDLPVRSALPALADALAARGAAVLVAPPGTGKTTLVPLALAGTLPGRIVVAEPRRVAARAAARRMAALLGETVGGRVGYSVRGESRRSAATRVEVVTTGLLVRRLQADPELSGLDAVVLDECHERHLDTDLALAFCLDVRAALRPDLPLLAMSATAQAQRLAALLGRDGAPAPVVEATGALHDVAVVWAPPSTPVDPPHGIRVDPRLLGHVADTVRRALAERTGDVLVFLPGAGEIGTVAGRLSGLDADVLPLHGRLPTAAQDAALRAGPRRRVVLSTALAESSLTVPGVRVVVDAGLSRVPRADLSRGLGSLVTVRASRAAVTQRAGRAGREGPGAVYRCWTAADHDRLPAHDEPEVATADLTAFALELACWGAPGGRGLALLDAPPPAALLVAEQTLQNLGAVDDEGRATARGRALTAVGVHPRLVRALLDGAPLVGRRRAAEIVALLSGDTSFRSDDLGAAWRSLRDGADRGATARWREEVARLERGAPDSPAPRLPDDTAAGLVVGLAHPERLARRPPGGTGTHLMAAGTGAALSPGTTPARAPWPAIAAAHP